MYSGTVTAGFLIEKTFARKSRDFLRMLQYRRPELVNTGGYSVVRTSIDPGQMPRQYRGVMRDPLQLWIEKLRGSGSEEPAEQELAASLFLTELTEAGKADDDYIFDLQDARKVIAKIPPPVEREIIWSRRIDVGGPAPPETILLGYEPSATGPPDWNSALATGFFFAYWPTDHWEHCPLEFYHAKLNRWGLFDTPEDAAQYLEAYLRALPSEWDERLYHYHTTEVRGLRG